MEGTRSRSVSPTRMEVFGNIEERRQQIRNYEAEGNYGKSFPLCLQLAEEGDSRTQYRCGFLYMRGDCGAPQDTEKALNYFEQAAAQGDTTALINLGCAYVVGDLGGIDISSKINPERGRELLQRAITLGDRAGLTALANLYRTGAFKQPGTESADVLKAVELYEQAIAMGDLKASYSLGLMYQTGIKAETEAEAETEMEVETEMIFPINLAKAVAHLKEAADVEKGGFSQASLLLAQIFFKGGDGVEQDSNVAIHYANRAVSQDEKWDKRCILTDDGKRCLLIEKTGSSIVETKIVSYAL